MSVREYIGARYVPLFADPLDWDSTKTYEPLTIVLYQGNSYTSRQAVPTGIEITNETYWAETGNYNAQVEAYRNEVTTFDNRITQNADDITSIESDITTIESDIDTIDANGWVVEQRIANNAVTTNKIADNAITTDKIADDAISTDKIADDAITTDKIADNAITADKIADDAITTNKVADDAITADKIADNAIRDIFKSQTNFLTPEMFGALGDEADDTVAFQAMFDAAVDRNICILTKPKYTIKNELFINNHFISMIGMSIGEMNPQILFDHSAHTFMNGITIHGSGVSFENIHFLNNTQISNSNILYYDVADMDATINNCVFGMAGNHIKVNGRNIKIHDCLFSSWSGSAFIMDDPQISNMRGYHIYNNRFHSGSVCVNTDNVTNYDTFFALIMENNYIDGCSCMYYGISDNININNNTFHQHNGSYEYIIDIRRTLSSTSHVTMKISGNYATDLGASTRMQGFIRFADEYIHGGIEISGNFFDNQLTQAHPVISIVAGHSYITRLVILNNFIRTANNETPIQINSNYSTTLKGAINGNYISHTGSTYYTLGSLTDGVNYHD